MFPSQSLQTSLQRENIPDEMDAEQTWPTEEEIAHARAGKLHQHHYAFTLFQLLWLTMNITILNFRNEKSQAYKTNSERNE